MVWTREELASMPDSNTPDWDVFMLEQYQRLARRAESEGDTFARSVWAQAVRQVSGAVNARSIAAAKR